MTVFATHPPSCLQWVRGPARASAGGASAGGGWAEAEATAAGGVGTTDGGGASSRPTTASVIDLDGVNVAATLDAQEL